MKQVIFILCFLFFSFIKSQTIYSKDYGNKDNPPIIFIHGGPSGNATLFEGTTAEALANKGFYVIVYDRRGEGRSKDDKATMTFKESFEDLLQLYKTYNLKKANILGHSFGGIIATLFTNQYPEKVNSLTLAGALFSQQETYDHILKGAKEKFKDDPSHLKHIGEIENLNKNSAEYRKSCYDIASEMNLFTMPAPTPKSKQLREEYASGDFYKNNYRNPDSPLKFYKNESQNNLNNINVLKSIKKKGIPIFAVYGKDDGIFSEKQISELRSITGDENFSRIDNCSHYLFVDQQDEFLKFIVQHLH
ncbi:alpha/beta hydrolase [Chryseobacterium sp. T16E-39]|uniref:alpha/beta hydrolase n=1 Tax=Chryseobacterium sp. T16E-39 TaxID=2015076 RepID=UPI000B5B247E|nr:alpha/beta hydrolase [Chryseobacterium sp. T16E-39]ASK30085.1 alpha/beta hydrolase [Chryseobacterium sp. T16E-39]